VSKLSLVSCSFVLASLINWQRKKEHIITVSYNFTYNLGEWNSDYMQCEKFNIRTWRNTVFWTYIKRIVEKENCYTGPKIFISMFTKHTPIECKVFYHIQRINPKMAEKFVILMWQEYSDKKFSGNVNRKE
jgi:hypothetical protein